MYPEEWLPRVPCGAVFAMSTLKDQMYSPFQIAVHNREEHLEKQVDGVYQHRQ
jgi:hypothetical protein